MNFVVDDSRKNFKDVKRIGSQLSELDGSKLEVLEEEHKN